MKKATTVFVFFMTVGIAPSVRAFQTDLVFPWITNQPQFRTLLTLNNLGSDAAAVTLTATRALGQAPETETVMMMLAPFEQLVIPAGELFQNMGEGSGYMVRMTGTSAKLNGAFVVTGTQSASGSSPAQANVIATSGASSIILFNYLTLTENGFSAPVVINMGDADTLATYHAYQGSQRVATAERTIAALHPHAELVGSLFPSSQFPELSGNLFVVVEADQPLLGVAFIFNSLLEPSMANASAIDEVPNPDVMMNPTVSYANDIQPIFDRNCGEGDCHLDGSDNGALVLDAGVSHRNIVNVLASPIFLNLFLIEPFNPEDSYLYRKLLPPEQASYFPDRMPKNRPPLSDEEIMLIRDWIAEGALDN